jgi:hypothetical protein
MSTTQVEAALDAKAHAVPQGTLRHTCLVAAKRFKSSWAELGKLLVRVKEEGSWEEWGYQSLEAYCLKELHLRQATVEKLIRSFSFLQRHEPRAVAREDFADDTIWSPERPTSELKRDLVDRFPRPPPPPPADAVQLRRLAASAHKLHQDLSACRKVPKAVAERAAALASDVEELAQSA